MIYVLSLIITYLIVFLIAIIPDPRSVGEIALIVFTLAGLAGEVHYVLKYGRVDLNRYVKLPVFSFVIGGLIAFAGTGIKVGVPAYKEWASYKESMERWNSAPERHGLYDGVQHKTDPIYGMLDDLPYEWDDDESFSSSPASKALYTAHRRLMGPLPDSVRGWLDLNMLDRKAAEQIRKAYSRYHHKLQVYISSLPNMLAAVAREQPRRVDRRKKMQPVYDSLVTAMKQQLSSLERDIDAFAEINSNPGYWDVTIDPPCLIHNQVISWRKNIRERAPQTVLQLEKCSKVMSVYYIVLTNDGVILP